MIKENKMKKLLLILICLFVSFEVKSEYIVLECEVKKKLFRINDIEGDEGEFRKNIPDTSFDLITLYLDEKLEWLNDSKIDEKYRDKIKLNENNLMSLEDEDHPTWKWSLDDKGGSYQYSFDGFYKGRFVKYLSIELNKDSGYFEYRKTYNENDALNVYDLPSYKPSYYSNGYFSSGVCKKITKSLF